MVLGFTRIAFFIFKSRLVLLHQNRNNFVISHSWLVLSWKLNLKFAIDEIRVIVQLEQVSINFDASCKFL